MINALSKLSAGEKKVLFITIFVVVIALFDRLFLGPVMERIDVIKDEIVQQETNIKMDLKFLSHKKRIEKENEAFKKYYSQDVPEEGVVNGEILSLLERISSQSNVKLSKSTPSSVEANSGYQKYFIDVDCEGTLKDIVSFMHAINSTDQLLKVDQYKMSPKRGAEDEVRVSMAVVKLLVSSNMPQ